MLGVGCNSGDGKFVGFELCGNSSWRSFSGVRHGFPADVFGGDLATSVIHARNRPMVRKQGVGYNLTKESVFVRVGVSPCAAHHIYRGRSG